MNFKSKYELFTELLEDLTDNHSSVSKEYKYIGIGNPFSDILIIGKEAAISIKSKQYENEILSNYEFWRALKQFDNETIKEKDFANFSPLYPYKGQLLKKDNGTNWGISKTWMNYHKLIDKIYDNKANTTINFHEKSFITEVNSTPSKQTILANKGSISFRKKYILNSNFIKSFPVVIISGVGYFNILPEINEIEKIFNVRFSEKKFANNVKKSQPYWIHWNKNKTKIVINTNQLSIGVSDLLLDSIAFQIKNANLLS